MTEQEQLLRQSQSFLPVNSQIQPQSELSKVKTKKSKLESGGSSFIYQELKKIEDADVFRKRQCLAKYLKQQGEMKDTTKIIQKIQQQGHSIPIMEVAIAISRYDNKFLKELLDSKTIQEKEQREEEIYEMNQKMKHDPILCLLSQSEQLKKMAKPQKQPSFLDFKQISPKKMNELIDMEKGKLKKGKSKLHSMFQFPKQLKNLKNQLYSLPYINRYSKQLNLKKELKQKTIQPVPIVVTSLADLHSQTQQFIPINKSYQNENQLENTLKSVLQNRQKTLIEMKTKQISLPKIGKINSEFSLYQSDIKNVQNKSMFETIRKDNGFDQSFRDTQKTCSINPQENKSETLHNFTNKKINHQQRQFWPSYQRFSPHRKRYRTQIQKLQQKVRSLTELSQIPSETTMNIYTSLKGLQINDLKKLERQSYREQKVFSNTKYRIKYKNLRQSYTKRVKQFTKDKKMRQFQMQQHDLQQRANYRIKTIKFNDKILEKMVAQKS